MSNSRNTRRTTLSVVVPAYNEQEVLPEFNNRLNKVLDKLSNLKCEIVYINDGSKDDTYQIMTDMAAANPRISLVNLSRNFGKEIALTAGVDHALGDAVVVIDADLQDPPELIEAFVEKWNQGYDVVYGKRTHRDGESATKRLTAYLFYRVIQRIGGKVRIPEDTGDFRLISRRAVNALGRVREQHRFMKGLFAWIGFRQAEVLYRRDARFAGETKWNYWKLWQLSIEGVTSFTTAPLKISTYVGLAASVVSAIYTLVIIGKTILFGDPVAGYPSLMAVVLMLGGLQLMVLGIIGEYLGRVFNETKHRPLYLVQDRHESWLDDTRGQERAPESAPVLVADR